MRAIVRFSVEVDVEVPDDLPERVRELARTLGENYVSADATDDTILARIASIRGVRGLSYDEAMDRELDSQVRIDSVNEEFESIYRIG